MPDLKLQLELDRCPHCQVDSPSLPSRGKLETNPANATNVDGKLYWQFYACARCGGVITAASPDEGGRITRMYPDATEVDKVIPETAREYLSQALSSLHAPAGAIMLAASAVDAMLKAKDYKEGSLYFRIEAAVTDHLITKEMSEWAHEVRLDANDQRHGDESASLPNTNDARRCNEFAQALADFLFVFPDRVERGRSSS